MAFLDCAAGQLRALLRSWLIFSLCHIFFMSHTEIREPNFSQYEINISQNWWQRHLLSLNFVFFSFLLWESRVTEVIFWEICVRFHPQFE